MSEEAAPAPATGGEAGGDGGAAAKPAPPPKPKKPPRQLPTQEEIAAWIEGDDCPHLANLFNLMNTKLFDVMMMQVRKEELLPQHWQVITRLEPPPDEEFERLAEVGRLRLRYRDQELSRRRVDALRAAWRELRGKRPSLWTVSDLFAAQRRLIDKKIRVDWHDLFSAIRDVWRDLTLPHGREQVEVLWACLGFIRTKTKK